MAGLPAQKGIMIMIQEIYFAAGCFWGTQRLFQSITGVVETSCGYANGRPEIQPDYKRVCQGDTDYRETVLVRYDPGQVTLPQLLKAYFHVVDPTLQNRQGNDIGTQYQAGIYYTEEASGETVRSYAEAEARNYPVFAVEVCPLSRFVPAEDYHQDYLIKNPTGYCHIPRMEFDTIDRFIRS